MAYAPATPANLKMRYPAFAAVDDSVILYWLGEARADCTSYPDEIRARAEMAYAGHQMVEAGVIKSPIPAGVTEFRSGTFSAKLSDAASNRTGLDATTYGRELKELRRRAFAGPRVIGLGDRYA